MEYLSAALTALYGTVCVLLSLFGAYRVVLLVAWLHTRRVRSFPAPSVPDTWPRVTVQLPIYNERFVLGRLLKAVARLDYPRDRLQIQILDDSTDHTAVLSRRAARLLAGRGLDVERVHRPARVGFKAGALAHGLETATGDVLALFDADFVPAPDFLRRTVPALLVPRVGVVQARWGHLNRTASLFTRLQAILLDGHFGLEQPVRSACGWLLTFNGTAGVWRREAIVDAGGWTSDTLTEDLDLSLRAQLAGWRIVYREDIVVPAELPADSNSFRAQQRRWTQGGVQVARKMLPAILRSPLPLAAKAEAALHFAGYAAYPLLLALALLRTPTRLLAPEGNSLGLLPGELALLVLGTVPLALCSVLLQRAEAAPGGVLGWLRDALLAMALGAGLAVGNAIAVVQGLQHAPREFVRTPKHGSTGRARPSRDAHRRGLAAAYRSSGARVAALELLLCAYLVGGKAWVPHRTLVGEMFFLSIFAFGLLAMAVPSLRDAWAGAWSERTPSAPPARRVATAVATAAPLP